MKRAAPALAAAVLLAGCVLVPRTVHNYDPHCRVTVRTMELQAVQIAGFHGCSNEGCGVLLAAAGATAAASAVISGSIMVIGNVVYWLERQGTCPRPG